MFFGLRFFLFFLRFLRILARFWEALGPPKIEKKLKKIEKIVFGAVLERVWDLGSILEAILERFWWIWDGFWMDFGYILEGFWKDFGKILQTMIRATKGISMDGWMDGWME